MKSFPLIFVFLFFVSCASQNKEEVDIQKKITAEKDVTDGITLGKSLHEVIRASKTLTEKQKLEVENILAETKKSNMALSEQAFKLRSVLIKELLSGNVDVNEINQMKKDIRKNDSLRLKNTFSAIDRITTAVGKDLESQLYMNYMLNMDHY